MTYRPENTLKERVTLLTTVFVTALMRSLRETSLEELTGSMAFDTRQDDKPVPYKPTAVMDRARTAKPRKPAKRNRRKPESIRKTAAEIILYVGKHPNAGAEAIRTALHLKKAEWLQPIAMALTSGLKKKGKKRATVYFVAKAKPAKTMASAKETAKKKMRREYRKTGKVTVRPSVVAAGDASSPTPEPTETNGTSTQVEVHPVLTPSPS